MDHNYGQAVKAAQQVGLDEAAATRTLRKPQRSCQRVPGRQCQSSQPVKGVSADVCHEVAGRETQDRNLAPALERNSSYAI